MVRHSGFLALTLLVVAALTITARVGQSQTSDSDLRRVVQEWTSRCSSKEETQDPIASQCWLNAASALTRYTDGNSEPLVKEVEQLQADWLERAAQLQVPATAGSRPINRRLLILLALFRVLAAQAGYSLIERRA